MKSTPVLALLILGSALAQADASITLYSQNFEGYTNGQSIGTQSPWAAESTTEQVHTSAKRTGDYGWQVRIQNAHASNRRRAYDSTLLTTALTDDTSFTLSLWINNYEKADSGANVGYVGLFDTATTTSGTPDFAPLHNFIGINLGGNGTDRHPYYGLQVRTPGADGFIHQQSATLINATSTVDAVIVGGFNLWYRLVIAYDTDTRTFTYNAYDTSDNVVITASAVLPSDKHFTVNSFGMVDGSADDNRKIGVYVDDVLVTTVPEPAAASLMVIGGLCAALRRSR